MNYSNKKSFIITASSIKNTQLKLNQLQKYRRQHVKNILFQRKIQSYYTQMLHIRLNWSNIRYGSFWEKDVPIMSEQNFNENFRMGRQTFQLLCSKMSNIAKRDSNFRKCIPLEKRVAIALYALKSSSEYASIGHMFGVSKPTVCCILKEFCIEVWNTLSKDYLPSNFLTEAKIKESVEGFKNLGFPQCFGAIDGCHIEVHPPASETSDYYNYKGWYSTILLAVVDFRYRFLYINVGCTGRCNDSAIFESSQFRKILEDPILKENTVIYNGVKVPVMLIGDSAFRLSNSMMKPYPFRVNSTLKQKTFNYSLSKCRRVVENAFGQLKARFRRIGKGIDNQIVNVNIIIKCCCVLHNFLNENNQYLNDLQIGNILDTDSRREQPNVQEFIYDYNPKAEEIRNAIATELLKM